MPTTYADDLLASLNTAHPLVGRTVIANPHRSLSYEIVVNGELDGCIYGTDTTDGHLRGFGAWAINAADR